MGWINTVSSCRILIRPIIVSTVDQCASLLRFFAGGRCTRASGEADERTADEFAPSSAWLGRMRGSDSLDISRRPAE